MSSLVRMLVLMFGLMALAVNAEEPRGIQHNPFARPSFDYTGVADVAAFDSTAASSAIELRVTMVTGNSGLAYVGDRVLRPGDDVDGFTLASVYEDRAVFTRANQSITVYVKPERSESDENQED